MKYLTHKLSQCHIYGTNNTSDYKCDVCGVILYLNSMGNYKLITNNGNNVKSNIFLLTCDEWIIRKIIE